MVIAGAGEYSFGGGSYASSRFGLSFLWTVSCDTIGADFGVVIVVSGVGVGVVCVRVVC